MVNFAVIRNGVVDNIIVAETVKIAEEATNSTCVELPDVGFGIGDLWDGTQFIKFVDPVEPTE
jgi:hypothetical protein